MNILIATILIVYLRILLFAFWNLAKRPWSRTHTEISDAYFLGSFIVQGAWSPGLASCDLQVLRCYTNAYQIYKGATFTATPKLFFWSNYGSMINPSSPPYSKMPMYRVGNNTCGVYIPSSSFLERISREWNMWRQIIINSQ